MLKREISYEDFDGNKQTDIFYFNLTKSELVELEADFEGGLEKSITAIAEAKDGATLLAQFKRIILMSYGIKSPDGKRFEKSDKLREEFQQTAAYDQLFIELATDEEAATKFIQGIIPRDLGEEVQKEKDLRQATAEKLGTAPKTTAEIAAAQA